jgi:hypothetical protein
MIKDVIMRDIGRKQEGTIERWWGHATQEGFCYSGSYAFILSTFQKALPYASVAVAGTIAQISAWSGTSVRLSTPTSRKK